VLACTLLSNTGGRRGKEAVVNRIRPIATTLIGTLWVLAAAFLPASSQSEDPYGLVDDYGAGDYGRIVHHDNGLRIERAFVDPGMPAGEQAGINTPVFPGDTVITEADQRVEIQLAAGSVIRADGATEATFLSLPDPYAEFADHTVIQLAQGSIRVSSRLAEGEEFRIDTPASSVYLLADGDFRIDVTPGGRTEVISRGGVAEVVGDGGSILLRGGMRTEVFAGGLPEEPWAFNTFVTDAFDRWVDERRFTYGANDEYVAEASLSTEAYAELPEEVQPYYGELERHGDWVYVAEYGHVWYPTSVAPGWSPYRDGYWSSGPGGWFWVSYEPWGWAPYHYGRWNWVAGYGWCWAPGRVFAGAWVAWSWGSAYLGWAPLDCWGRPAYVNVVRFDYYDPQVWTFVDYRHVARRDYQRYAVRVDQVGDGLRNATVLARTPRVGPDRLARSAENREFAQRVARTDRASWLRPVDRNNRPGASHREVEQRMLSRRSEEANRSRSTTASARRTSGPPARDDGRFPAYPRQARGRTVSGTDARSPSARSTDTVTSRGAGAARRSFAGRAGATDQRVRNLYRKVGEPRSSADRGDSVARTRERTGPTASRPVRPMRGSNERSGTSRATRPKRNSENDKSSPSRSRGSSRSREARPTPPPEKRRDDRSTGARSGRSNPDRSRSASGSTRRSPSPPTSAGRSRRSTNTGRARSSTVRPQSPSRSTATPKRAPTRSVRPQSPSRSTATPKRAPTRSVRPQRPSAPSRSTRPSSGAGRSRGSSSGTRRSTTPPSRSKSTGKSTRRSGSKR
jgi:hypothetical protein